MIITGTYTYRVTQRSAGKTSSERSRRCCCFYPYTVEYVALSPRFLLTPRGLYSHISLCFLPFPPPKFLSASLSISLDLTLSLWIGLSPKRHSYQTFSDLSPFLRNRREGITLHSADFLILLSLLSLFPSYPSWISLQELQILFSPLKKLLPPYLKLWHPLIPEKLVCVWGGGEDFEAYQQILTFFKTLFKIR